MRASNFRNRIEVEHPYSKMSEDSRVSGIGSYSCLELSPVCCRRVGPLGPECGGVCFILNIGE